MSTTEIYGFDKDGNAYAFAEIRNAWRGAMAIWGIMEERYLPPYIPEYVKYCNWYKPDMPYDEIVSLNGFKPTRTTAMMDDSAMKEVWRLYDDEKVSETDKIVLGTTFDRVVVRKAEIPQVIEAFTAFEGETSLKEQAAILQAMLEDENCIAVAWNQTSVCGDSWDTAGEYDKETDEPSPYNLNKQDKHWFLFDDESNGDRDKTKEKGEKKMIATVRFESRRNPGEFSKQEYSYKTSLTLAPGDMVICPTAKGEGRGVVSRINVPEDDVPDRFRDSLRSIEKFYEAPPSDAAQDTADTALMPAT